MNQNTVTLVTDNGEREVELVYSINIEEKGNYVIYKLDNELYGAKYELNGENTRLITDLSDEEKIALNEAFEEMVSE